MPFERTRRATPKGRTQEDETTTQQQQPTLSPDLLLRQAQARPSSLSPDSVLQLQRLVGNRAVGQLLGREAPSRTMVQRKGLQVGAPDDQYEQEADHIADRVTREPTPVQRNKDTSTSPRLMKPISDLQRDGDDDGFEVDNKFSQDLKQSGTGQPLPSDIQAEFGSKMGADLRGVRLHTDNKAADLSARIQAKAFTHGRDIYMGREAGSIQSGEGKRTLAHEAVHTIQQTGGSSVQRKSNKIQRNPLKRLFGRGSSGESEDVVSEPAIPADYKLSLTDVFLDEFGRYMLLKHLETEFSTENYYFLRAIDFDPRRPIRSRVRPLSLSAMKTFYDEYTSESARRIVNIKSATRINLRTHLLAVQVLRGTLSLDDLGGYKQDVKKKIASIEPAMSREDSSEETESSAAPVVTMFGIASSPSFVPDDAAITSLSDTVKQQKIDNLKQALQSNYEDAGRDIFGVLNDSYSRFKRTEAYQEVRHNLYKKEVGV